MKRNHRGYRIGADHHRATAADDVVAKARRIYRRGVVGYRAIAETLGVGESTVRDWVQYRTRP